ncbi:SDR family NAD(P)-dependent oxidoreductase [Nonomuraea sp. B1E8]|uniref:SDR family NAD(P)-dependent oxidoreductase n=1 Tax=unclassified Nonomuraea TaxID=2593643 RepID=UPI00325D0197
MSKVWFVTGSSRGFGRSFVEAALSRGDRVAATARNLRSLDDLVTAYGDLVLTLEMDVKDTAAVRESVTRAKEHFGRLDVIVNNAGYALFGAVEELTEQDVRGLLETNLFGPLRVVQAVLPHLREQGSGHIIQISSTAGVAAFPLGGGYCASKWALEGLSESLAQEVAGFDIKVTIVEPGSYATGAPTIAVMSSSNLHYEAARQAQAAYGKALDFGDPAAAGQAMLEVADLPDPPLRVFFGKQNLPMIQQVYADRLKNWADWLDLSAQAHAAPSA